MKHHYLLSRFISVLLASMLWACLKEDKPIQVGGDDYPNSLQGLAKRTAMALGDSMDWNGFDSVPKGGPGLYTTVRVPDSIPDTSRIRIDNQQTQEGGVNLMSVAAGDSVKFKVDTLNGIIRVMITYFTDSTFRTDTTAYFPDDTTNPGDHPDLTRVAGMTRYSDSVRFESFSFLDADGDGFLSPRSGSPNLAELDFFRGLLGGVLEHSVQRLAAGSDLDFNGSGDNRLLASLFTRTMGSDTLDAFRFSDADGDSSLIDFSRDSNLVDMAEVHRPPVGNASVSVTRKVRIVSDAKDTSKSYPIRFSERRLLRDGSVVDVSVQSPSPDSSFRPGDDVVWTESTARPAGDSVAAKSIAWKVRLANASGAFTSDSLLGFAFEEKYRDGISGFRCDFHGDAPVADGKWVAGGEVVSSFVNKDGALLTFTGSANALGFSGTVAGKGVPARPVSFDRSGAIISKP